MKSAALARTTTPWAGSASTEASAGIAVRSPAPARYIASARRITPDRRARLASPYHASIVLTAHSGVLSSWQVVQAFGTPYWAVISGTGGANV